jgi:hypothetical protein
MHTTPVSLLQRLRQAPTPEAWDRFVGLYTPCSSTGPARPASPPTSPAT